MKRWVCGLVASLLVTTPMFPGVEPLDKAAAALVEALLAEGRFDVALERSTEDYGRFESSPFVRAAHGRALFRAGRLAEATAVLEPLESDPQAPAAGLVVLARLAASRGGHERAATLAERAVEQAPDDPFVLFWAAELVFDRSQSNALLTRYLELAPESQADWIEAAKGTLRLRRGGGGGAGFGASPTPPTASNSHCGWSGTKAAANSVTSSRRGSGRKTSRPS